jgi:hypothetical protein
MPARAARPTRRSAHMRTYATEADPSTAFQLPCFYSGATGRIGRSH